MSTDKQLISRYLAQKDELALEELVRRHLGAVYSFVRAFTGDRDEAGDIAQETFVKVWQNLRKFDQSRDFRTWLFTIAKRTAIDHMRAKKAVPFSVLTAEGAEPFEDSLPDIQGGILEQLIAGQSQQRLAVALATLKPTTRQVIGMHLDGDMTFRSIAEELGQPLNTVKSAYRRGMKALAELLGR